MSAVSDILSYLDTAITTALPTVEPVAFAYNLEQNTRLADNNYALRISKASAIPGNTNALTLEHDFEIELLRRYSPKKGAGDADLRAAIALVYADIQALYTALALRSGTAGSTLMLLISPVDVSEPQIDNDNNVVTCTLTIQVRYRVAI